MHPELLRPPPAPSLSRPQPFVGPEAGARIPAGRVSRLPADWIHDGGLRAFRGDASYLGRSIAALKLYLTLVVTQDAGTPAGDPAPIVLSYERIAALSGLSDPSICAGKKALLDQGLVTTCGERPGRTIAYRLTGLYPAAAAASVLHAPQIGPRIATLHSLTCRKAPNLAVLKTYLLMSACGGDPDGVVSPDVDIVGGLTGLSPIKVIAALAALQELGLAERLAGPARFTEQCRLRLMPLR